MKQKYTKLFMEVDEKLTKQANELQDWENLKVIFEFLHNHIGQMISKERKNPSKFPAEKKPSNGYQ